MLIFLAQLWIERLVTLFKLFCKNRLKGLGGSAGFMLIKFNKALILIRYIIYI